MLPIKARNKSSQFLVDSGVTSHIRNTKIPEINLDFDLEPLKNLRTVHVQAIHKFLSDSLNIKMDEKCQNKPILT